MMKKVLVIDDDRLVRHIVTSGLQGYENLEVLQASDGETGLEIIDREQPLVLLLDIFLPEQNGLELFRKIRAINSKIPVIFITADTSSEMAIQAMRSGAFDYLSKPLNIEQVRNLTISAVRARQAMEQPVAFSIGDGVAGSERFIGRSSAMIEVYKSIGRVAAQNVTVLVRGESGCGKELVARAVMQNSNRVDEPFVAVNCAAIPDQLLESELFGHEKGAFTGAERRRVGRFEQCHNGTIFLDEIGDMSPIIQGKVLRLLQEQKFERVGGNEIVETNVRIITATNRPLERMVEEGTFREDLLYRLNGFTIQLPPLRERIEDIPLLLEYFFRRAKHDMCRPELEGLSPEAFDLLQQYDWPGNVRQLQSVVRQSVLNTTGTVIAAINLPDFVREVSNNRSHLSSHGDLSNGFDQLGMRGNRMSHGGPASPVSPYGGYGTNGQFGRSHGTPSGGNHELHSNSAASGYQNSGDGGPRANGVDDRDLHPNVSGGNYSGIGANAGNVPFTANQGSGHGVPGHRGSHFNEHENHQNGYAGGVGNHDMASSQRVLHEDYAERNGRYESEMQHGEDIAQRRTSNPNDERGCGTHEFKLIPFVDSRIREGSTSLYAEALEQMERRLFTQVLEATGGNQSRAAEILGITRGKVRDRIASFGIHVDKTVSVSR